MDGRHRRPEGPAPPLLPSLGRIPRQPDQLEVHAGPPQGRAAVARLPRRRGDGMVDGVEGQPVGAVPRRRPRNEDSRQPPRRGRQTQGRKRRTLQEPLRRASAVPDRRQLRRDRRHRRNASPVARARREGTRHNRPPARPAVRMEGRRGQGTPRARRIRSGHQVARRQARRLPDMAEGGESTSVRDQVPSEREPHEAARHTDPAALRVAADKRREGAGRQARASGPLAPPRDRGKANDAFRRIPPRRPGV